jgi:hypothetical protein
MVFEPTFPVFEWWKAAYALSRGDSERHINEVYKSFWARSQNCKCLSVRPHGTALLALDGIL